MRLEGGFTVLGLGIHARSRQVLTLVGRHVDTTHKRADEGQRSESKRHRSHQPTTETTGSKSARLTLRAQACSRT